MRVAAIIPAKARSRRVPNKNMRLFRGKPLVAYTIEQALASTEIDDVFVSTDDPEIQRFSESCGARVPFLRPPGLSADDVHGSVPVLDMLERLGGAREYAYCALLLPTSPLRKSATIDAIVATAREHRTNVLSVAPLGRTPFHLRVLSPSGRLEPLLPEYEGVVNVQTGDSPEVYYLASVGQCAPVEEVLATRSFQYGSPLGYVVDPVEATDIDTERDFQIAERLAELAWISASR